MQSLQKEPRMTFETREKEERLPYITPVITTLSEAEILEEIGPARAYTGALPFNF